VDVVISNGVINLAPDKVAAFSEIFRALKPGGRLYLADIVVGQELDEGTRSDIGLWAG
jgi:SAM-dependent methyltransferase